MWDNNKITEAKLVSVKRALNETHLTSSVVVAIVFVLGAVSVTMEMVWLHIVAQNLYPKFEIKLSTIKLGT